MEPVTCYLAEAFYNVAMFNQEKYYVAAGDEPAVHDAFVHFRTVQELLNREGGPVPSACLGRLRISRTTLGGLNPEQGVIEKTVDRRPLRQRRPGVFDRQADPRVPHPRGRDLNAGPHHGRLRSGPRRSCWLCGACP